MAKKSLSKKQFKGLFSKSEANADGTSEKEERSNGEKKLQFFRFNVKSRSNAVETVSSAVTKILSDHEEAVPEGSRPAGKSSTRYATAPRSKVGHLSFSEQDLRKPRRFGTFSFGLRKKKDTTEVNFSKSTICLHDPGTKEDQEERLDLGQQVLAMSQPELDTVATKRPASDISLTKKRAHVPISFHSNLNAPETLTDSPDAFDVDKEMGLAPIATIPELEWDGTPARGCSRERDDASPQRVKRPSKKRSLAPQDGGSVFHCEVSEGETVGGLSRDDGTGADHSGDKTTLFSQSFTTEILSAMSEPCHLPTVTVESDLLVNEVLQPLSAPGCDQDQFQPDEAGPGPDKAGFSHLETSVTSSFAVTRMDADDAYRTVADTNGNDREDIAPDADNEPPSVHQTVVNPEQLATTIHPEGGEPPGASTTVSSDTYPAAQGFNRTGGTHAHTGRNFPHSAVKPEDSDLVQNTVASVSAIGSSAPPSRDYASSLETGAQVSVAPKRGDAGQGVDHLSTSDDPSPSRETMAAARCEEALVETTGEEGETFSEPKGQLDDGYCSPVYVSVGSEGSSVMDVYFSAEEDNWAESEVDETKVKESGGAYAIPGGSETYEKEKREEELVFVTQGEMVRMYCSPQQSESVSQGAECGEGEVHGQARADERTEHGGTAEDRERDARSTASLSHRVAEERERVSTVFGRKPSAQGGEVGTEEEEEGKEELPATPVQLVEAVMECEPSPPSSEPHERGPGLAGAWEKGQHTLPVTEDQHENRGQLWGQGTEYLSDKGFRGTDTDPTTHYSDGPLERDAHTSQVTAGISAVELYTIEEADEEGKVGVTEGSEQVLPNTELVKPPTNAGQSISIKNAVIPASHAPDTHSAQTSADTFTGSTGLPSEPSVAEGNGTALSSGWANAPSVNLVGARAAPEQPSVEPPAALIGEPELVVPTADDDRLPSGPGLPRGQDLDALSSQRQQVKADLGSAEEMSSGVDTTFHIKPRSDPADLGPNSHLGLTSPGLASLAEEGRHGPGTRSGYQWRNSFEGVSQYKQEPGPPDSVFSPVFRSSRAASLPEATAYTRYLLPSRLHRLVSPETRGSLGDGLSDGTEVPSSRSESAGAGREGGRGGEWEELAAPASESQAQARREAEKIKASSDAAELSVLRSSLACPSGVAAAADDNNNHSAGDEDASLSTFTGVFKATRVDLIPGPASPVSPDTGSPCRLDMETLKDTLKSMGPSQKQRSSRGAPFAFSSLPPIVEDTPSAPSALPALAEAAAPEPAGPTETPNGRGAPPPPDPGPDPGAPKDRRSPLETRTKQNQQEPQQNGALGLGRPLTAPATDSIVARRSSSDSSKEDVSSPPRNGLSPSRLDNSVLFSSYRPSSIDWPLEDGKMTPLPASRSLYRTGSLPDAGSPYDRMSVAPREGGVLSPGATAASSNYGRFSFLLNSSPGSLAGDEDPFSRVSNPLNFGVGSAPSHSPRDRLLSPTGAADLQRPAFAFATADLSLPAAFGQMQVGGGMGGVGAGPLGSPPLLLQRSFSNEGMAGVQQPSLFNDFHGGSHFRSRDPEPDKPMAPKYRAFPDAYLTKEKAHGKLNPRPGKMYVFDRPGMSGQRTEVRGDVVDATSWQLQETISIRVIRGGWVLYEKPDFKGEKIALDEGDVELTYPFTSPEEEEERMLNGEQTGEPTEATRPKRRFIIGSLRRAVRDYSVPEISLFPEENAEGKKVVFRDTSDDARIFGFPIKANSIIIKAGLWLVYAEPFFQGAPRVLEVGGFVNPAAWGVERPYVGSVHPLKIGAPTVESPGEPKIIIYDKPYFTGKSRTIYTTMKDFMTRSDRQQTTFMYNVGSLKVLGGIWVGYEKEGFRGHQYLLEEGDYQDWRVWGGCDAEMRSVRVIRADLTDPMLVMYEQPEEDEENTFEVTEAIPDVELFDFKTSTRSIHVLSGAWIAYSHVDFSGNQYILEKGFYSNYADWGSLDDVICSVQPILLAPNESPKARNEVLLYSEPDFEGECLTCNQNWEEVPKEMLAKSCRVMGGSWVIYEGTQYSGSMHVLSEGDYPNFNSMGCPASATIHSLKAVPLVFSIPSISLFGLECLEGKEITTDLEVISMVEAGFNDHILSVRVNSGCWVLCEYSNYRGRQFLLEPIEITNWLKFSSMQTIGSMYPVRQRRRFFRIKNRERGHFLCVQGGVEEMKTGRVVVAAEAEPMSDVWFYEDGFIKNKLATSMSLQVMGNVEPAAKVVLWSEARQPIQTWTAQMRGTITSITFPGMVLDVKGGRSYDKDHVVLMPESQERLSQQWELKFL